MGASRSDHGNRDSAVSDCNVQRSICYSLQCSVHVAAAIQMCDFFTHTTCTGVSNIRHSFFLRTGDKFQDHEVRKGEATIKRSTDVECTNKVTVDDSTRSLSESNWRKTTMVSSAKEWRRCERTIGKLKGNASASSRVQWSNWKASDGAMVEQAIAKASPALRENDMSLQHVLCTRGNHDEFV